MTDGNEIGLVGILASGGHTADQIPMAECMPDGFISMVGGASFGDDESHAIIDMQVFLDRERLEFALTELQARELMRQLRLALKAAVEAAEFARPDNPDGTGVA